MFTQAPMAICGQSVLAAATLAVQPHRDVMLPAGGRKPLTALFVSIAESGERKTSVDRHALAAARDVEEGWRQERKAEVAAYVNDLDAWKTARDVAKKKHKGDRAAIRAALSELGAEPKAPPQAMMLVEDFSPEALVLHLRDSRPWAGLFTSEGGLLMGGHAFTDEKIMQTGALLNTLWDGSAIRRTRVLAGTAFLSGRRVSAHLMMQQVAADRLLGSDILDGLGLLARMLVVAPESTAGTRFFRSTPGEVKKVLDGYDARLDALFRRPPVTKPDCPDVLDPLPMRLDPDARKMWIAFYNEVERAIAPGGELASVRAFAGKMAEHAGRLAAVMTAFANPDVMLVHADAMAGGIALTQHYAAEMLRLQGAASVQPDLRLAARLLAWWQERSDPKCHLAMIYQRSLNAIGDAATARRIVAVLEEHGWVRRLPAGQTVDGAKREDAWELIP
ncbi:conserved hypothetical protein [uncultured Defluviicoccus sp.]|uniref:DUF3987 domain-containing protein n=1 Tax=metagenome TaxID=256318 RepID=A0A380TEU6_9ZZZZ|nr:conserved hypothetical protein [uncultured Defluviicoccus sp.]